MTRTTPLEEVLLAEELDVAAAIELLDGAAGAGAVPALSLLERCLTHADAKLRAAALRALTGAQSLQVLRALMAGLSDRSEDAVAAAAQAMLEGEQPGPTVLVAFHPQGAARRVAARRIQNVDLLYLLLADPASRPEAIERLQKHRPIASTETHATIVRTLLTTGDLPPAAAGALFRADPGSAGLLALQMVKSAVRDARGEPEVVYDRPRSYGQLLDVPVPPLFATIVQWLDATPGAWLALLGIRETVLDPTEGSARMASLTWLSLTVHAARLHAARKSWNAEALIVESTTMPWLLLSPGVPPEVGRAALRGAAGTREQNGLRSSYDWDEDFIASCLRDPITQTGSGVRDLRAVYALLDVHAGGRPLQAMDTRLGKAAIVQAAEEGAADLAWMIAASKWRGPDHLTALRWLESLASENAPALIAVTETLPLRYWKEIPNAAANRQLDGLLGALAASDASTAVWSAWASAITGTGPSVSAVLESAGYRAVRPSTALFPQPLSEGQLAEAKRLGVPALLEHVPTGIVLVLIPGGEFLMGARDDDPDGYPRERPARSVVVDTFYLGVTPVTQGQWVRAMPEPELPFRDAPSVPVRGVNWKTSVAFLEKLNCGMRLPHEEEWEYGARAGTTTRYWWGDAFVKRRVNCQEELFAAAVTPVRAFPPNAWGLVDILGNVWEWCEEWFTDPMFPSRNRWRVLRGGSWFHERWNARVTERFWGEPEGTDTTGVWGVRPAADLAICFGKE
ncbi:MAG TPA: SUMF1/EgtB/PvdO family nonheme iron enzyme [Thermoanaerobaculia bacterium]